MYFEINLIKDRVVPRNLGAKRLVIVGSFVGLMLVVTLFVSFLGLRKGYDIQSARAEVERQRTSLSEVEPAFEEVQQAERDRSVAQRRMERMFAVWDAPIHFGAFFRHVIVPLKTNDDIPNDKIAVVDALFTAGTNNNQIRVTTVTNDSTLMRINDSSATTVASVAKKLADGPGRSSRTVFRNAAIAPSFADRSDSRATPFSPPSTGAFVRLDFAPASSLLFRVVEAATR